MGVPSYFLWLVKKFEEQILTQRAPNRPPDNVFLDWNCGIHPAVKKEGLHTMELKLQAALDYLDSVFYVARPHKLFYIAIDGVAPRAKMQQQRKRRFKSVQDARFTKALKHRHGLLSDAQLNGEEPEWDYNMISPGTVFMDQLASRMRAHIKERISSGGAWHGVKVIFSDSTIPGEGEHKIMDYIRENTLRTDSNMIYGLDSDLIFLTLINFRPNMYLLREQVTFGRNLKVGRKGPGTRNTEPNRSNASGRKARINVNVQTDDNNAEGDEVQGGAQEILEEDGEEGKCTPDDDLGALAEQLISSSDNLENQKEHAEASGEKDTIGKHETEWVFLSLDNLREVFLKIFNPYVSLGNLENYKIFGSRAIDEVLHTYYRAVDFQDHAQRMMTSGFYHSPKQESQNLILDYIFMSFMLGNDFLPALTSLQIKEGGLDQLIRAYKIVQVKLCQYLVLTDDQGQGRGATVNMPFLTMLLEILTAMEPAMLRTISVNMYRRISSFHRSRRYCESSDYEKDMLDLDYVENKMPDYIRLGKPGWKERYYDVHFHLKDRNPHESKKYVMGICEHYMKGMLWTLEYYTKGCPDWSWEYPFHSSPTVSDMWEYCKMSSSRNKDLRSTIFKDNTAVTPLEQLMTILPPESAHLLPHKLGQLMKDPTSSLAVYYPLDFSLDIFGKRYRWECHPLLPTIPQSEIKAQILQILPYLTPDEKRRNEVGEPTVFM